jgi:hypothetical protein
LDIITVKLFNNKNLKALQEESKIQAVVSYNSKVHCIDLDWDADEEMFVPTVFDDIKLNAPKTFQEIYFTSKGSFRSIEQVLNFIKDQNITKD